MSLTPRERQVLDGIWMGLSLKEIASETGMSLSYVCNIRLILFRKLRVHSMVQCVRRALEMGLLQLEPNGGEWV